LKNKSTLNSSIVSYRIVSQSRENNALMTKATNAMRGSSRAVCNTRGSIEQQRWNKRNEGDGIAWLVCDRVISRKRRCVTSQVCITHSIHWSNALSRVFFPATYIIAYVLCTLPWSS